MLFAGYRFAAEAETPPLEAVAFAGTVTFTEKVPGSIYSVTIAGIPGSGTIDMEVFGNQLVFRGA